MKRAAPFLEAAGIGLYGAVPYKDCLPLLSCRAAARIPADARAVLMAGFPYYAGEFPGRNISRYAAAADYHQVAGEMLKKASDALSGAFPYTFAPFVDNSPIREVSAAARAGLGVIGKNGLLIHPVYGSFLFLGSIVTDMPLICEAVPPAPCIGCGACQRACPGGCIGEGGVDKGRCLSFITQKKGELSQEEAALVRKGGLLWGCDVCQEVCPYNRSLPLTSIPAFREGVHPVVTREDLLGDVKAYPWGYKGPKPLLRNLALISSDGKREER